MAPGHLRTPAGARRLDLGQFEKKIQRAEPGDFWYIHAFRRDELRLFEVELQAAEADTVVLKPGGAHEERRRAWLGGE